MLTKRLSVPIGLRVEGIRIGDVPSSPSLVSDLRKAILQYGVLLFPNQRGITDKDHMAFAKSFGVPEAHPIVKGMDEYPEILQIVREAGEEVRFGEVFHADNSYMPIPTSFSILRSVQVPSLGNDTLFSCTNTAFQALSEPMKQFLRSLKAFHSASKAFTMQDPTQVCKFEGKANMKYDSMSPILKEDSLHPVVALHPETHLETLYVNSMFTTAIKGLRGDESASLLQFLYAHMARPEYCLRVPWESDQLVMWDNRRVQHVAVADSCSEKRVMRRITLKGSAFPNKV